MEYYVNMNTGNPSHIKQNILSWPAKGILAGAGAALIICICITLILMAQVRLERKAAHAICQMGGTFTMESAVNPNPVVRGIPCLINIKLLNRVYKIDLSADALAAFPKNLRADKKPLTEQGLRHLRAFSRLRVLDLQDAPVTDAALIHLQRLKSLRSLNLRGTNLSAPAIKKLQNALPQCNIEWDL